MVLKLNPDMEKLNRHNQNVYVSSNKNCCGKKAMELRKIIEKYFIN